MKTGFVVQIHFGPEIAGILNDLPGEGFIFPCIAAMKETDRAKAFIRRFALVTCEQITGVIAVVRE